MEGGEKLKTISACLKPEQIDFLRSNGGISPNIRKAVELLRQKKCYKVTLDRANKYGHVNLNMRAKNLDDLLSQLEVIIDQLDEKASTVKDTFWYLYSIEEVL